MSQVSTGQVYRWLGADVRVDEVAEDGSGARITIRQDGCRPQQKWTALPLPAEAVLVSSSGAAQVQAAAVEITSLP